MESHSKKSKDEIKINKNSIGIQKNFKINPVTQPVILNNHNQQSKDFVDVQIFQDNFRCSLCMETLCEPITISCGHTFCRICLVDALKSWNQQCPNCREPCHIEPKKAKESILLSTLIQNLFPLEYSEKLLAANKIKKTWFNELPIFFYNQSIYPGQSIDLHLFEPRYRIMIQRIIQQDRRFVFLPSFQSYTISKDDVGLIMHIEKCEFLYDQRALISSKVVKRCIINKHWIEPGTQGLNYCEYMEYDDSVSEIQITSETIQSQNQIYEQCQQYTNKVSELIGKQRLNCLIDSEEPNFLLNKQQWSFYCASICYRLMYDINEWSLEILKLKSPLERCKICIEKLEKILQSLLSKKNSINQNRVQQEDDDDEFEDSESHYSDQYEDEFSNINYINMFSSSYQLQNINQEQQQFQEQLTFE